MASIDAVVEVAFLFAMVLVLAGYCLPTIVGPRGRRRR
jgi:hypothetical protein